MVARRADPEARREALIAAAVRVFAEKSVAAAAVSDIVKEAGVAQGTFYLYFASKGDVVHAVAEQITDQMADVITRSVTMARGAVAKLTALRDAFLAFGDDAELWELAEIYHRPENRATHDRMADRILLKLEPLVEGIVREGIEEGVFDVEDPEAAAWFVLGGLHVLELGFSESERLTEALRETTRLALRALSFAPPTEESVKRPPAGRRHAE
jgi:TetR/AcrR family fatty acid metabolism transcriptional regulator